MILDIKTESILCAMAAAIRGIASEGHARCRLRDAGYTEQEINSNITEVIKREVMRREMFMEKARAV